MQQQQQTLSGSYLDKQFVLSVAFFHFNFASLSQNQCGALDHLVPSARKKRAGSLQDNSDNVAACVMNKNILEEGTDTDRC